MPLRDRNHPFRLDAPVDWKALRRAMEASEFTLEKLSNFAGVSRPESGWDMTIALRRTAETPKLKTLIRLLLFGTTASLGDVEDALTSDLTAQLTETAHRVAELRPVGRLGC